MTRKMRELVLIIVIIMFVSAAPMSLELLDDAVRFLAKQQSRYEQRNARNGSHKGDSSYRVQPHGTGLLRTLEAKEAGWQRQSGASCRIGK
jgi:hypothetical protein